MCAISSTFWTFDWAERRCASQITSMLEQNVPEKPPKEMTQLLDHLYLGTFKDATDLTKLKQHGITHVINTVERYLDQIVIKI